MQQTKDKREKEVDAKTKSTITIRQRQPKKNSVECQKQMTRFDNVQYTATVLFH